MTMQGTIYQGEGVPNPMVQMSYVVIWYPWGIKSPVIYLGVPNYRDAKAIRDYIVPPGVPNHWWYGTPGTKLPGVSNPCDTVTLPAHARRGLNMLCNLSWYVICWLSIFIQCVIMFVFLLEIYDIEDAIIEPVPGGVYINVTFLSLSSVVGCFIVVQSDLKNSDQYRVLARKGLTASNVIPLLPVDTGYTVFVYDLEDGLPSKTPAIQEGKDIHLLPATGMSGSKSSVWYT